MDIMYLGIAFAILFPFVWLALMNWIWNRFFGGFRSDGRYD